MEAKIVWFIVALFTGAAEDDTIYTFQNHIFQTEANCVQYVKDNYLFLNAEANIEFHSTSQFPNIFYCMNKKMWYNFINAIEKHVT